MGQFTDCAGVNQKDKKEGKEMFEISENVDIEGISQEDPWFSFETHGGSSWTSYILTQVDYDGGYDL